MLGDSRSGRWLQPADGGARGDADDAASLVIRYTAGVDAAATLSLCRRDRSRGFEFVGEEGTLRYRWEEEQLQAVAADGGSVSVLVDHRGYDVNQMYVDLLADFLNLAAGGQSRVAAAARSRAAGASKSAAGRSPIA